MTFSIQCACGNVCQVRSSQAGTTIKCRCGLRIGVPALRRLQAQGHAGICPADTPIEPAADAEGTRIDVAMLNQPAGRISSTALVSYVDTLVKVVAAWSESVSVDRPEVGLDLQIALALVPVGDLVLDIQAHPRIEPAERERGLCDNIRSLGVPRVVNRPVALVVHVQLHGGSSDSTELPRPFAWCYASDVSFDDALAREAGIEVPMAPRPSWWRRALTMWKHLWPNDAKPMPATDGSGEQCALVAANGPFADGDAVQVAAWLNNVDLGQLRRLAAEYGIFAPLQELLVRRLLDTGNAAAALQAAHELARLVPDDATSYELRAAAYRLDDQIQASLRDYSRALEIDPQRGACWAERARILMELGGHEAADAAFTRALETQPLEPNVWLDRACARILLAKYEAALEDVETSMDWDPHGPRAYAMRAQLRLMRAETYEDFERVIADLSRVLQLDHQSTWALAKRADIYCRLNKFQLAIEDCARAIQIKPDDALAHGVRGYAEQQLENLAVALQECTRAIELGLRSPLVFLSRAICWHAQAESAAAMADCDAALEIAPEFATAYNYRGMLHVGEGDLDAALADFSEAARLAPEWHMPLLYVAGVKRLCDEPETALDACDRAIELEPRDVAARLHRALILMELRRPQDALQDLDQAIRLDADCDEAYVHRAEIRLHRAEYQAALADLNVAAELQPANPAVYHLRARTLMHMKRTEEAIRDFNQLVQLFPDSPGALLLRSEAWYQLGLRPEADHDVHEAIRLAPDHASELHAQQLLAEACASHRADDFATAVARATELLDLEPDHVGALHIRAASYWYSEHFVEALDDYNRLMEFYGDSDESLSLLNSRGQIHAELGEFEQAIDDLSRSIQHARRTQDKLNLAYSLNGRGLAYTGLAQYTQAERDFDESLNLCPDNGWLHYNIGLLRLAQSRFDAARASFGRALESDNPSLTPRKKRKSAQYIKHGTTA